MTASAGRPLTSITAMMAMASVIVMTQPAKAGEVADKAAAAETLLSGGQAREAFAALDAAVDAFWAAAPLTLENVYFLDGAVKRADGPFRPGEAARVYLEPVGYGLTEGGGSFSVDLKTGIEIRTPGGLILAKSEDFGSLGWKGTVKNRSFNARLGIDLPDLKPGDYELLLTVTDPTTEKSATASLSTLR